MSVENCLNLIRNIGGCEKWFAILYDFGGCEKLFQFDTKYVDVENCISRRIHARTQSLHCIYIYIYIYIYILVKLQHAVMAI